MRAAAALVAALVLAAPAGEADAPGRPPLETLREVLEQRFPDRPIVDIVPSPVAGLYEVYTGQSIVYADASGDYLFVGPLVDTRTRADLSAERLDQRNAIDFDSLPSGQAVSLGSGSRRLAMFCDTECPYCRQMQHTLETVADLRVEVFLFPAAGSGSPADQHARAIWCAQDRGAALKDWVLRRIEPPAADCEADVVAANTDLARSVGVTATPTLIFENGRRVSGAIDAEQLEQLLRLAAAPDDRE